MALIYILRYICPYVLIWCISYERKYNMANNRRVYYGVECAAISAEGSTVLGTTATTINVVHGLQSIGVNTNFNLEPVFELGQLAIYENIENIPDVEVTMEKVLDGYPPLYCLATLGSLGSDLAGRSTNKAKLYLSIFDDSQKFASGVPKGALVCSGIYTQQVSYSFPVEGNFTESLTLIGNHKQWYSTTSDTPLKGVVFGPSEDSPLAIGISGGVNRRENIVFTAPTGFFAAAVDANGIPMDERVTVMPVQIPGINASGLNTKSGTDFNCHLQSIEVSTNLGRDELFELGRRTPYFRFVSFPTEVTCSITVTSSQGDAISALEEGNANGAGPGSNLRNETIRIRTMEGLLLDLGNKNKITSITQNGADAGGGNETVTYTFSNNNDLTVKHDRDPTTGLRPTPLDTAQFTN